MSWNRGILRAGLRLLRDRIFSIFYREYEKRLEIDILNSEIPHHVAVIMDGNRRYAGQLGKTRSYGKRKLTVSSTLSMKSS